MRTLFVGALAFVVLASPARAQDAERAIIEKAVKAHGGAEKLAKHNASRVKTKGTIDIMGLTIDFTSEAVIQFPSQIRTQIEIEVMGNKITVVQVLNGDKAWVSAAGNVMEIKDEALKEVKHSVYAARVATLVPLLKEKEFKLSTLGEVMIDKRPAVGIKVAREGHRDIDLYFDKETWLLTKSASTMLDPSTMMEANGEAFYRDYKERNGMPMATKVLVNLNGKKFVDAEVLDAKNVDKVDDSEFAKPQ